MTWLSKLGLLVAISALATLSTAATASPREPTIIVHEAVAHDGLCTLDVEMYAVHEAGLVAQTTWQSTGCQMKLVGFSYQPSTS